MTFVAPRPGRSFDERDESNFRSQLELYLRTLTTSDASASTPYPIDIAFNAANANATATPPAGLTEWNSQERQRTRVDLTGYSTAEFTTWVTNASSVNAKVRVQYTLDLTGATGWDYLDGSAGPSVAVASTGSKRDTVLLTAAAQDDVLIRLVTIDGDGANDVALGLTRIRFT